MDIEDVPSELSKKYGWKEGLSNLFSGGKIEKEAKQRMSSKFRKFFTIIQWIFDIFSGMGIICLIIFFIIKNQIFWNIFIYCAVIYVPTGLIKQYLRKKYTKKISPFELIKVLFSIIIILIKLFLSS